MESTTKKGSIKASHKSKKASNKVVEQVSPVRRSSIAMTKYEHAKIIGIRAEQIARGAQQFVRDEGERFDPVAIATRELHAGVLPFIAVRNLPDGSQEKWCLREFSLNL